MKSNRLHQLAGAAYLAALPFAAAGCETPARVVEVTTDTAAPQLPTDDRRYEVTNLPPSEATENLHRWMHISLGAGTVALIATATTAAALKRHPAERSGPG